MKLKKLELYGFKSFAERTLFEFEDRVSALVGPNGAGKSNVADAIKWVLGERSAQKLRGSEMASVIFDGSKGRKPLNFADVKLTIDNSGGWLRTDYEEVCIRRRVDRTGRSDYFLNGQQCRLKDIRNLLLDTGVGASAYSFIEQGQIDQLLRASATERRTVFEEAAGINRFLEQKREAERKLERVNSNLERVGDIIEEVQHQLRSVKYQAGRARTFKRQTRELQKLRLAYSLHHHRRLQKKRQDVQDRRDAARERKSQLERDARTARRKLRDGRERLEAARQEANRCRHRLTRVETRLESLQREARLSERRREELEEQLQQVSGRRQELEESAEEVEAELREVRAREQKIAADLERLSDERTATREEAEELRSRLRTGREELENRKNDIFDLFERETQLKNQLEVLAAEKRTLQGRTERLENQREKLQAELGRAETECSQTRRKMEIVQTAAAALAEEDSELRHDAAEARKRLEETVEREERLQAELSVKVGRRDVLRDLEARAEDVRPGVKALLDRRPEGLLGLVADLVEVPLELAPAVEAVLGDRARAAVFQTAAEARRALAWLRNQGGGRADMLVLDRLAPCPEIQVPESRLPRGRLSDLVGCAPPVADAMDLLLGNALLVEDAEAACRLLESGLPAGASLVTPEGECFGSDGLWSGGSPQAPSLISRRSELAELESEIEDRRQALERLEEEKQRRRRRLEELEDQRGELAGRTAVLDRSASELRSHVESVERRIGQLRDDLQVAGTECETAEADIRQVELRREELRREADAARERRESAQRGVQKRQQQLEDLEERRREISDRTASLETELARAGERRESLQQLLKRLNGERDEKRRELEGIESQKQAILRRREEAEEAAGKARQEQESLRSEEKKLRATIESKSGALEELRAEIARFAEREAALAEKREEAEQQLQELRLAENETEVKLQDLLERTAEDYGVALEVLERNPETWEQESPFLTRQIREFAPEEAPTEQVAAWYREEPEEEEKDEQETIGLEEARELRGGVLELADDADADWQDVKGEIARLKKKVDRIGNVNVAAIRQQEELETRLQFLTDQKEDLEKARRHERQIVRELNKKSRRRFSETFEEVSDNFQALFRKLFGGGTAELRLVPEDADILEAGIEVKARPPGKETCSISLLSGGEKALTTVALLFAIFQSKPSPFCLLDEVDAPLDDSNVERFLSLVQEFARQTQFIIITHNKLTMSVAQVLYGVTMTDGVTRKLSVRLEDVEEGDLSEPPPRARAG